MRNFEKLVIGMILAFPTVDAQAAILGPRPDNEGNIAAAKAIKGGGEFPALLDPRFVTLRKGGSGATVASGATNRTSAEDYKKRARAAEGALAAWAEFAALAAEKIEDPLVERFATQMGDRRIVERKDVEAVIPPFLECLDRVVERAKGGAASGSDEAVEERERVAGLEFALADRDAKLVSAAAAVRTAERATADATGELAAVRAQIAELEDNYATVLTLLGQFRNAERDARIEALEAAAEKDTVRVHLAELREHQIKAAAAGPLKSPISGYADRQRFKVAASLMSPDKMTVPVETLRRNAEQARLAAQALRDRTLTPPDAVLTRYRLATSPIRVNGSGATAGDDSAVARRLDMAAATTAGGGKR